MERSLDASQVRAGLPVAWTAQTEDGTVNLLTGHPGRVTAESVDTSLCEVGVDLFVDWHDRPRESQLCFEYGDVEVITEEEYADRVAKMKRSLPPGSE